MYNLIRPLVFKFSPETAHALAIKALKINYLSPIKIKDISILKTKLFDKIVNTPIGVAAGFDKNAEVYNQLFNLGFGLVEVGTVTPKPQFGNPRPRVFRLEEDEALINRLGFNNNGSKNISERIKKNKPRGFFGINIGPNKDSSDRIKDYIHCFNNFYNLGDYITINISSPNTENLRHFHDKKELNDLLQSINEEKKKNKTKIPIAVKISPDLNNKQLEDVAEILISKNVDVVIISNSTDRNRENLSNINRLEKGGLTGKPIEIISNRLINQFYKLIGKKIKIIGVGGVDSAKGVYEKIKNGASLVQLYTGMVYQGPNIALKINKELINILKNEGVKEISELIGTKKWTWRSCNEILYKL